MKKILYYLLALCISASTSCSKDAELGYEDEALQGGNYKLTAITAELDNEKQESRTSLQTSNNNVVYWSSGDMILLVNTTNYESWYYMLASGSGTSVGKFVPIASAAVCEEDMSNIVAVYPAVAAVVDKAAKTLSFTINNDWNKTDAGKEKLTACNIRSWSADSPYAFTHNDIKVSYKVNGTTNNANFKFRQLGVWCNFTLDFTNDSEIANESLKSIEITTTEGDVQISGTQRVDLTSDANYPTLIAKNNLSENVDKSIKWVFSSPLTMFAPISRQLILFPGLENKQLKITAETTFHTLVFYAKPTVKFEAGTTLKFPISYGQNFSTEIHPDLGDDPLTFDMAYSNEYRAPNPFYYYGNANCVLIAQGSTSATFNVAAHEATAYYGRKDNESATSAPAVKTAKVIWYETAMSSDGTVAGAAPTVTYNNNNTVTVNVNSGKYGNMLVGVYGTVDGAEKLLWSFHVWYPKDNPEQTNRYTVTRSGAYEVMPMHLGATEKGVYYGAEKKPTSVASCGLLYQWGRKDPLGRIGNWSPATLCGVTVVGNTAPDIAACSNSTTFFTSTGDGVQNIHKITQAFVDDYNEEAEGKSLDRYMLEIAKNNPTKFVASDDGLWTGTPNTHLWSNPKGADYPVLSALPRSVFDPCPAGYRVAPSDLWTNFKFSVPSDVPVETGYNFYFADFDKWSDAVNTCRGFNFYYSGTRDAEGHFPTGEAVKTDFYTTTGYRDYKSANFSMWNNYMAIYSSAPVSGGRSGYILRTHTSIYEILGGMNVGYAVGVRCVRE